MKTTKTKNNDTTLTLKEALQGQNLNALTRFLDANRGNVGRWRREGTGLNKKFIAPLSEYLKMEFIGYSAKNEPLFKRLA